MERLINGIHHITAIAGATQENIDFYTGILGLRLVKKTVNFDAPDVYHFYYGDGAGSPGSLLTFFPYNGLANGRHGKGMLNTTAFSVPAASQNYWMERLKKYGIPYKAPEERFEREAAVYFEDNDGLGLALVFNDSDEREGFGKGAVPPEYAIKGFYNAEIWEEGYERTAGLLTEQMDHKLIAEKGNRFRFATQDLPGHYIDILCTPDSMKGLAGSGTVHHIAFATATAESQMRIREKILTRMLNPTPVINRDYFTSVYFREPGGVLFEIATEGPGFAIDEDADHLGEALRLPEQYEPYRKKIEEGLAPVKTDYDAWK